MTRKKWAIFSPLTHNCFCGFLKTTRAPHYDQNETILRFPLRRVYSWYTIFLSNEEVYCYGRHVIFRISLFRKIIQELNSDLLKSSEGYIFIENCVKFLPLAVGTVTCLL